MEVPQVVYEEVIVEVPEVEIKELLEMSAAAADGWDGWMRLKFRKAIPSTMDKSMDESCLIKVWIMIGLFFQKPWFSPLWWPYLDYLDVASDYRHTSYHHFFIAELWDLGPAIRRSLDTVFTLKKQKGPGIKVSIFFIAAIWCIYDVNML